MSTLASHPLLTLGHTAPIVQFKYPGGQLAENVPEKLVSVVRHGNQNVTSHIRCIQSNTTSGTLNGTHLQTHSEDIRMEPGQSEAFCRLRIIDDNIWEGNSEVVLLTIVPLDEHTIGGHQTTFRGSVIDSEDSECRLHTNTDTHSHTHTHTHAHKHTSTHAMHPL